MKFLEIQKKLPRTTFYFTEITFQLTRIAFARLKKRLELRIEVNERIFEISVNFEFLKNVKIKKKNDSQGLFIFA